MENKQKGSCTGIGMIGLVIICLLLSGAGFIFKTEVIDFYNGNVVPFVQNLVPDLLNLIELPPDITDGATPENPDEPTPGTTPKPTESGLIASATNNIELNSELSGRFLYGSIQNGKINYYLLNTNGNVVTQLTDV